MFIHLFFKALHAMWLPCTYFLPFVNRRPPNFWLLRKSVTLWVTCRRIMQYAYPAKYISKLSHISGHMEKEGSYIAAKMSKGISGRKRKVSPFKRQQKSLKACNSRQLILVVRPTLGGKGRFQFSQGLSSNGGLLVWGKSTGRWLLQQRVWRVEKDESNQESFGKLQDHFGKCQTQFSELMINLCKCVTQRK